MYSIIGRVLGVPQYAPLGVPAGISRRQWLIAVALALLALGLLVGWLGWAKNQGQGGLAAFEANSRINNLTLAGQLTRSRATLGSDPVETSVLLLTPALLRASGQEKTVLEQAPARTFSLMMTEDTHENDLTSLEPPRLRDADGVEYSPVSVRVVSDSYHHRVSLLAYAERDSRQRAFLESSSLEMAFSKADTNGSYSLRWDSPLAITAQARLAQPLSLGLFLALFGGLLASMWPCLFQLTAYFIPTIAGLSMEQIEGSKVAVSSRLRVVKTAIFFVAGFTIVYTLIGGLAGYAGSTLGDTLWIDNLRRPISIAAGIAVIFLAIRMAVNARAPFVCKMPIGGLHSRKGTGPLGTMFTGLIFASGCMTCFGAALLIGLVAYVGTSGSVLLGAGILFLFSLGIGIPLVIAAVAMARILPLLGRLEKIAPYLALASSVIMIVFGIMMITNNLHVISSLLYEGIPLT